MKLEMRIKDKNNTRCMVCGFDLKEPVWNSEEICPSCGIQYNYYDDFSYPTDVERLAFYSGWRNKWKLDGMKWSSVTNFAKPKDWNPLKQIDDFLGSEK